MIQIISIPFQLCFINTVIGCVKKGIFHCVYDTCFSFFLIQQKSRNIFKNIYQMYFPRHFHQCKFMLFPIFYYFIRYALDIWSNIHHKPACMICMQPLYKLQKPGLFIIRNSCSKNQFISINIFGHFQIFHHMNPLYCSGHSNVSIYRTNWKCFFHFTVNLS